MAWPITGDPSLTVRRGLSDAVVGASIVVATLQAERGRELETLWGMFRWEVSPEDEVVVGLLALQLASKCCACRVTRTVLG